MSQGLWKTFRFTMQKIFASVGSAFRQEWNWIISNICKFFIKFFSITKFFMLFVIFAKRCFNKYIKTARVVKLKLAFMEWFFYNLLILIKLCKIWYLNLDKELSFLRNQAICLKDWKLWRAPTTTKFNIFAEILHTFPT